MKEYNKVIGIFFAVIVLLGAAASLLCAPADTAALLSGASTEPASAAGATEQFLAEKIPFAGLLRTASMQLRIAGGLKQRNGVFITASGLIADFQPTDETLAQANTEAVAAVGSAAKAPTYLMLLPTACAIYQERITGSAPLYDQKGFIERTYRQLSGVISTVDIYPVLFAARDDYIYYRTDSDFTSLGGYKIYSTLTKRLGNAPRQPQQYEIVSLCDAFYGDLSARWGYGGVRPDVITGYLYRDTKRLYRVTHYENDGTVRLYYSLYPPEAAVSGSVQDVILGGLAPVTVISSCGAASRSGALLLFGDDTAASYLPLLAHHYNEITFIRADQAEDAVVRDLDFSKYAQVVFAYSVDTYMTTDAPQRAVALLAQP